MMDKPSAHIKIKIKTCFLECLSFKACTEQFLLPMAKCSLQVQAFGFHLVT